MPAPAPDPSTRRSRRRAAIFIAVVIVLVAGYRLVTQRSAPAGAPLPANFPPVYPGATSDGTGSDQVADSLRRAFRYTSKAKADELVSFYREQLPKFGLKIVAQGGGPYGGVVQAVDASGKRAVTVEIDAPEGSPEPARIRVSVMDSK